MRPKPVNNSRPTLRVGHLHHHRRATEGCRGREGITCSSHSLAMPHSPIPVRGWLLGSSQDGGSQHSHGWFRALCWAPAVDSVC